MKKRQEKTLNVSWFAAGHAEGSNPPDREGYSPIVADFTEKNYQRLLGWCHKRWNGSGQDVLHEALNLAGGKKNEDGTWARKPLEYMTFNRFCDLCREAARNLGVYRTAYTKDGVIFEPPREGMATPVPANSGPMDPRIRAAIQYASPVVAQAMRKVLEGHTFREAAHQLGLTESQLSQRLAKLGGRRTGQLNLFVSGGAA